MTRLRGWTAGCVALLLCAAVANAAPAINLSKKIGPPTSEIAVWGHGFRPHSLVDIYFDTKDEAVVRTNNEGEFQHAVIHAPKEARPGEHWVTVLERNNGNGSQKLFVVFTDWPDYRFSKERIGSNPYENVLKPSNVVGLALQWNFSSNSSFSDPVIVNGVLYVGSTDGNLYALNAHTGSLLWKLAIPSYGASPPTVANGIIYVGSCDDNLYAIDAQTRRVLWRYTVGGCVWAAPAVVNGIVYFGADNFYALDATTGVLLWRHKSDLYIFSSAAVSNGIVCYGSGSFNTGGAITALDALSGKWLWGHNSGNYAGAIEGALAVQDGAVYVAPADDVLYAFDLQTGIPFWQYFTGGPSFSASVADGQVYNSSLGTLLSANARTGVLSWVYDPPGVVDEPVVANGVVYLGATNEYNELYVLAIDAATGTVLWQYPIQAYLPTVIVDNGFLYVAGNGLSAFAVADPDLSGAPEANGPAVRPDSEALHPDLSLQLAQGTVN